MMGGFGGLEFVVQHRVDDVPPGCKRISDALRIVESHMADLMRQMTVERGRTR